MHFNILNILVILPSTAEAESVKAGSIIRRWDYVMHISPTTYLRPSILAPLRFQSDILADNLVDALELKMGQDGLKIVQEIMVRKEGEGRDEGEQVDERVDAFWSDIHREWYSQGDDLKPMEKAGIDNIRQEGRDVFWRYAKFLHRNLGNFTNRFLTGADIRQKFLVLSFISVLQVRRLHIVSSSCRCSHLTFIRWFFSTKTQCCTHLLAYWLDLSLST